MCPGCEAPAITRDGRRVDRGYRIIVALAVAVAAAAVAYSWQTRSGDRTEAAPAVGAFRLTLDMQSSGVCQIWVSADGQRAIDRLFQSGERASVSAQDELVLRVGEPAVFAYTLNGVRGRQLGESGQAVTVRITPDNYEAFLQPRAKAPPPAPANLA